ncbi:MAG: Transcriptional regulatory protein sin3 [Vezdaea aestivalis]|nr:MAG: Transcriptional regulatory protein sin3 [Vezdaea aestivalis]
MNPSSRDNWAPPHRPSQPPVPPGREYQQQDGRPVQGPGPGAQSQQGSAAAPVLPPPSQSQYYPQNPQSGHSLPQLAGLQQGSPPQNPQRLAGPPPPQSIGPQQGSAPGPGYALPALNVQHQPLPSNAEREQMMMRQREMDREINDRERERDMQRSRDAQRAAAEQYELGERQRKMENQQQQQPHQNHAGSLHIHQPVASKVPATIHGPGGILSGHAGGAGPAPSAVAMGGAGGPGPAFGAHGPLDARLPHQSNGPAMPQQSAQQHHLMQAPGAMNGLPQGQQPILNVCLGKDFLLCYYATLILVSFRHPSVLSNAIKPDGSVSWFDAADIKYKQDALSYLDQVKVQFVNQSEVYNQFLDIMKDFKSQVIDTPGVIQRVSNLFVGHPNLIQGFNTFLPPGYRIECGVGDASNTIRVTTPQGTTNFSMAGPVRPLPETNESNYTALKSLMVDAPAYTANPANQMRTAPPTDYPVFPHPLTAYAETATTNAHQQEQRGVSQLQNAVSVATNGPPTRTSADTSMGSAGPVGGNSTNGLVPPPGQIQVGIEKRGPVEFNHAISYVNKIKNRFSSQPEIYKQFLEILQTYQRESKPIQDVYNQVTQLFSSATDLLEDFKQFLPESAAQAKAQAAAKQAAEESAMISDVRGEPAYIAGAQQAQLAHSTAPKMPPVGNFAPPPASGGERKKNKRPAPGSTPAATNLFQGGDQSTTPSGQFSRSNVNQAGPAAKRQKPNQPKAIVLEAPVVEPTLIPSLPEPLAPINSATSSHDEIGFFDRAKKLIGNKQTFNEFLKLCNLFTQDLISRDDLVAKASNFISGNPDLLEWFKKWVKFDHTDRILNNVPRPGDGHITLSSCRAQGPSYRLLPKREQFQLCAGRDEFCASFLNDEWASHPTWASEDSGFIAHRKNHFEEQLHRIEEERHDYDFNIQTTERTIQMLDPIAGQLNRLSEEALRTFRFDPNGGSGASIYQRVLKKLYGRTQGQAVVEFLHDNPVGTVPIVLKRLKVAAESWKASQREWNKVWRENTAKCFWKSLDHMGINVKASDKKLFQQKQLLSEIQTRRAEQEQERQRAIPHNKVSRHQFEYSFEDLDVVVDATKLLLAHISSAHNIADKAKLDSFLREFIPVMFGLSPEKLEEINSSASRTSPTEDDAEESASRGRSLTNGKKSDLLRGVLDRSSRSTRQTRADAEASAASGSKESTPEAASPKEKDGAMEVDEAEADLTTQPDNWLKHPEAISTTKGKPLARDIEPFETYSRHVYSFYCNANAYSFFRLFQIFYERLLLLKQNEAEVAEDVRRAKARKPADDLTLAPPGPEIFFGDTGPGANYYRQVLEMCEQFLEGGIDAAHFEDALRIYYLSCGWKLYTVDKLVSAILRTAGGLVGSEGRDRGNDIIQLFLKDREKSLTSHEAEMAYRKQVERLVKDGDGVFRIAYNQTSNKATIEVLTREDNTFDEKGMTSEQLWSYYTASYISRLPTEGIESVDIRMPLLDRNLRVSEPDDEESPRLVPGNYSEALQIRIGIDTFKMIFDKSTEDWFIQGDDLRSGNKPGVGADRRTRLKRRVRFNKRFLKENTWMKAASDEEKEKVINDFNTWLGKKPAPAKPVSSEDQVMADA